jgi:two-component system, NarL family, response regulator LiaR
MSTRDELEDGATGSAETGATIEQLTGPVRVAIVNDFEVIVRGLLKMLEPFRDGFEVVELDAERNPRRAVDVALFDAFGSGQLALERIRALSRSDRVGAVVVYTWQSTPGARELMLGAGADAVLAKTLPATALVAALEAIARGEQVVDDGFSGSNGRAAVREAALLTDREAEVLALLATGLSNREIAATLYLSENTVRTHLKSVFRKLGVTNRSRAVAWAIAHVAPAPATELEA